MSHTRLDQFERRHRQVQKLVFDVPYGTHGTLVDHAPIDQSHLQAMSFLGICNSKLLLRHSILENISRKGGT